MQNLLFFNEMITPKIITVIYWLLLIGVVVSGIGSMFVGSGGVSFGSFFKGLGVIVLGAIGVRIWSELLIVLFKINSNIQKMADKS
jgi:hypothetical protein